MKTVELYARVRRAVLIEGMSRRAAAQEFGLARKTVGKMLEYSLPPGYRRQMPIKRPKLGPWQGAIDAILEDDKQRPRKQRQGIVGVRIEIQFSTDVSQTLKHPQTKKGSRHREPFFQNLSIPIGLKR